MVYYLLPFSLLPLFFSRVFLLFLSIFSFSLSFNICSLLFRSHLNASKPLSSRSNRVLPVSRTKSLAWVSLVPDLTVPSGLVGLIGLVAVCSGAYCNVADR